MNPIASDADTLTESPLLGSQANSLSSQPRRVCDTFGRFLHSLSMIYFGNFVHNWRKDRRFDKLNYRAAIRLGFATHSSLVNNRLK